MKNKTNFYKDYLFVSVFQIIMEENCGLFAVFNENDCADKIHLALHFLQHRGQQYCGIATSNKKELFIHTHKGRCDSTFTEKNMNNLKGNWSCELTRPPTSNS